MRYAAIAVIAMFVCAGLAQAGIRADLSGDAVVDFATTMDLPLMNVGNPGNADDTRYHSPPFSHGAVAYEYRMGKFEVTAGQYTEFLNAVAGTDSYGLYNTSMWSDAEGCKIARNGPADSYTYSVAADWADRPVNFVSWGDSARFANWLTNGMPTGAQDLTTTEDGSYFLNGATDWATILYVPREADARYVIPTEDEWYKAAYHANDGVTGNYFDYPTGTNVEPSNDLIDPDPGNNGNFVVPTPLPEDYTIGAPYWRTEAGEFENSDSPYGTFDMGGNVWEWNEEIIDYAYRGMRAGAYWGAASEQLHASFYAWGLPTSEASVVGFRVSSIGSDGAVPGDFDNDGDVDANDLEIVCGLIGYPPCGGENCTADLDEDGDVDEDDLVYFIENLVQWDNGVESGVGTKQGDFNLDGAVNGTDLAIMKASFGSSGAGYAGGNANCDTVVNATDLAILKGTFGFTAPTGAVPGPATLSLLAAGIVGLLVRRKRRRGFLALLVAFGLALWASTSPRAMADFQDFPICTDTGGQTYPAISGNIVIWQDDRNGNDDIYGYDLATGIEFPVCTDTARQSYPAISGNTVIWRDDRNGNSDIYGYDIASRMEFPICTGPAAQSWSSVSGNIVVWDDYRNDPGGYVNSDIYGYDLATQTEFSICTDAGLQRLPSISGNTVAWVNDRTYPESDLYGYDLATQTQFPICLDTVAVNMPGISGEIIVWKDRRNSNNDIYGFNTTTETEAPICTDSASQGDPVTNGRIIVWYDQRDWSARGEDLYGYDLLADEEFAVYTGPGMQHYPAIDGDIVVWMDYRNGNYDIYGAVIPEPATLSLLALGGLALLRRRRWW